MRFVAVGYLVRSGLIVCPMFSGSCTIWPEKISFVLSWLDFERGECCIYISYPTRKCHLIVDTLYVLADYGACIEHCSWLYMRTCIADVLQS